MDHDELVEFWGFDPDADVEKVRRTGRWLREQKPVVIAALLVAAVLVALAIGDLTRWKFPDDIANHNQITLLVVSEAVLLVLVYWVIDAAADRRSRRQWEQTAGPVIASLRLNMILTQQRLDHALRNPDDDVIWEAMMKSASFFLQFVQTSQPMLVVHPELAVFAPRFLTVATRIADRAGALNPGQSVREVAGDPGVRAQSELLRTAVADLAADTRRFDDEYGAIGEPGTD